MEFKNFLFEVRDNGIAILTHNRPEVRNAMDNDSWQAMTDAFNYCSTAPEVKVVIITGAGEKAFIAGADLNALRERTATTALEALATNATRSIELCTKPVIAAVNGFAFGGGCETALACDIRIAAENAQFGLPEPGVGVIPGCGGTMRLARLCGLGVAKDVVLGGKVLKAQEAFDKGLAMTVVPKGEALNEAIKVAEGILTKSPLSIQLSKKLLNAAFSTDMATGLMFENFGLAIMCASEDKMEGTTAFLEKRKPKFPGR